MSNKTNFKRLALAVATALGLGVLASSPSVATVTSLTVTGTAGSGATTEKADSTTASVISVSFVKTEAADSVTVSAFVKSRPTGATAPATGNLVHQVRDSATSTMLVEADTNVAGDKLSFGVVQSAETKVVLTGTGSTGVIAAALRVYIDTSTGGANLALTAGTYVFTAVVTPFNNGAAGTPITTDVNYAVAAVASASTVVDSTKTVAILANGASGNRSTSTTVADSALAVVATAAATDHASFIVRTFNASGVAAPESVTVSISGAGLLCNGSTCGSSLSLTGANGEETITVRANGTAGVATIKVATTTKTFADKKLTFFATAPATVTPKVAIPVIGIGSTSDVIEVDAKDANGSVWGGQAYLFSSDTTIATAGSCSYVAADALHYCAVSGVKAGTAKFQIGNASTLALSTVKTAEFDGPVVNPNSAATVGITFDKAAYAPGEKARIYVTPLDSAGKAVAGGSITNLLATGGISPSSAFSSGSDTTTAVTLTVASATSATTGAKAGSAMYTVYMPFGKGTVTLTAKGGTGLPVAGQVAITASASVVDDSVDAAVDAAQEATDAAIAATDAAILAQEAADEAASAAIAAQETAQAAVDAVTALSAEVTKLVAQLATLQKLLNRVAKRVGVKL